MHNKKKIEIGSILQTIEIFEKFQILIEIGHTQKRQKCLFLGKVLVFLTLTQLIFVKISVDFIF